MLRQADGPARMARPGPPPHRLAGARRLGPRRHGDLRQGDQPRPKARLEPRKLRAKEVCRPRGHRPLSCQRRHPWRGALALQWHRGGDEPRQEHLPRRWALEAATAGAGRRWPDLLPGHHSDPRQRALEDQRHRGRDEASQGHTPRQRKFVPPRPSQLRRHALLRGQRRYPRPELWKSDGTAAGTVLVKDIYPGTAAGPGLTNVGGTLFFRADHHDRTQPRSSGSPTAPRPGRSSSRTSTPAEGSLLGDFTNVGGTLFFAAEDGTHGRELWKSDGTRRGRSSSRTSTPGSAWPASPPSSPTSRGTLLFAAHDGDPRRGAVEVRRHSGGDVARQRHQPGSADSGAPYDLNEHRRHALFWGQRCARLGALEVRRHSGGDNAGQEHRPRGGSGIDGAPLVTSVGGMFFFGPLPHPRHRALAIQRHCGRDEPRQKHLPRQRRLGPQRTHEHRWQTLLCGRGRHAWPELWKAVP